MAGYTQTELDDIQSKWGLRFPPDLLAFYRENRRVIDGGEENKFRSFDWLEAADEVIRERLAFPFEGFWAQVSKGRCWWAEWGEMPEPLNWRREKLKAIFLKVPKLIPLYGHLYLPEEPNRSDNPVFSVFYTDVIYYGANLHDYIAHETDPWNYREAHSQGILVELEIPFWSEAIER